MSQQPIDQFVTQLMTEAKLNTMPAEFSESYRERLTAQVYERIGVLMIKELNDNDATEFFKLTESDPKASPEQIQEFLASHIQDFEQKMAAGLKEFAAEFFLALQTAASKA